MPKLSPNHLIFWFGNTSYPSGFSRYAPSPALDVARMLFAAGPGGLSEEPGGTGGALDHTHSFSGGHTHPIAFDHTHSYSGGEITHAIEGTQPPDGTPSNMAAVTHAHPSGTSVAGGPSDTGEGGAGTTGSTTASWPPYVEAVLLQSAQDGADVPVAGVVLYPLEYPPDGFANCDANNHAAPDVDLSNKFIRILENGASPTGVPGTGGDLDGHTHTRPSHSHGLPTHIHDGPDVATTEVVSANAGTTQALNGFNPQHHNSLGYSQPTIVTDSIGGSTGVGGKAPPKHVSMAAIKKLTTPGMAPGMVVPYIGSKASLLALSDWRFCDGSGGTPILYSSSSVYRPTFRATFSGGAPSTGASAHSHNYNITPHYHFTTGVHTHSIVSDAASHDRRISIGFGGLMRHTASYPHDLEHTWTVGTEDIAIAGNVEGATNSSLTDHVPPYLEVLFAQYIGPRIILNGGTILGGKIAA